ncbi:MAG: hypothetical protein RL693_1777 [Verrucomicrobiota bacterium]|jgi:hypothetical protein
MKLILSLLLYVVCQSALLQATDLVETGFPAKIPDEINLGGRTLKAKECLQPWIVANPAEYAGQYVSHSITDGSAHLALRLHEEQGSEKKIRWHVDGSLETSVGWALPHIVTFKNAELREPQQPCFDLIDRLTSALFVLFTAPESKSAKPRRGLVMGENLYLLNEIP